MSRSPSREASPDPVLRSRLEVGKMQAGGQRRRDSSIQRAAAHILVWVPVVVCLGAAIHGGGESLPGRTKAKVEERGREKDTVVAVMRSAPTAAEAEGGMPPDLQRLMDDPVSARTQADRVALLYRRWAIRNPLAAGQSALANRRLFDSTVPLRVVLEEWLAMEPETAMGWVMAGSSNPANSGPQNEALEAALASTPDATRALWAARLPDGGARDGEAASGGVAPMDGTPDFDGEGDLDWLVRSEEQGAIPKTLRRKPAE